MTEPEVDYHPREIDEQLVEASKVAAHAFDTGAATTLEKDTEAAVFLEIRKWCSVLNRMKIALKIPLLERAQPGEVDEQVYNDLIGLEIIIGYGIMCSRRFGVTPNDPKLTVDRWYSWWNGWWSDLTLPERQAITSDGNFDIDLANQLSPKIDWKELLDDPGVAAYSETENTETKVTNQPINEEINDEQLDALFARLKEEAKTTIDNQSTLTMDAVETSIASLLGKDTVEYVHNMSELKLFHFVRESATTISDIANHFNVKNPLNLQAEVTDPDALADYFMAKTLVRLGIIVINKRCGVTFHAPGIDGFESIKNEQFRRWLFWWENWEKSLTIDRLIVAQVATQVEMGFDTYIKPAGSWQDVTVEQALTLTKDTPKDEKPGS